MINEEEFKKLVSKNLTNYRKINNLTQLELAEKLNYSDKAISKWERGESLPDIYTLQIIASFYGITINDLCMQKEPQKMANNKSNHIFVTLLSTGLVWLVATICFVILMIVFAEKNYPIWLTFIYAIPVSFIVLIVFCCLWYNIFTQAISVSGLIWGIAISLHLSLAIPNIGLVYIIAAVLEILVIIWYIMISKKKIKK